MLTSIISRIQNRQSLDEDQARALADGFFDGGLDENGMKDALLALNAKGIAVDELVGFAQSMRMHAVPVHPKAPAVDTCGTGGDGQHTFNISTAAAILVAACGTAVAKHGNRSQSSATGSADVLEALGVPINLTPEQTAARIDQRGFGFLFAPQYHPAMKRVAPVRKALGVKTIFNMLGPLTNPAMPYAQVIGTYSVEAQDTMAAACNRLGIKRAIVVHGDGNDEAGLGRTRALDVSGSTIREFVIEPDAYGIHANTDELCVENASQSANKIRMALSDATTLESRVIGLNAGLTFLACGKARDVQSGFETAVDAVQDGRAAAKLAQITEAARA